MGIASYLNSKLGRPAAGMTVLVGCLLGCMVAMASAPLGHGVLVHLKAGVVASFDARHSTQATRLNPIRDLYLVTTTDTRTDQELLNEIKTDPDAGRPELNAPVSLDDPSTSHLNSDQSTASVLNGGQSTASVLNGSGSSVSLLSSLLNPLGSLLGGGATGSLLGGVLSPVGSLLDTVLNPVLGTVLNLNIGVSGTGGALDPSAASVLNATPVDYYGALVPPRYTGQPMVGQIHAGAEAHNLATGRGAVVALIDNGVDPSNPVLLPVLLLSRGYNFYDNSSDWSAYADLAQSQSTASVLNGGQSTASVLNSDQSTASVLNGGPCAAEFGGSGSQLNQSTASVLNGGQSTASVLNGSQSAALTLDELNKILACDPDFGHGTSVAGLIHLVAPETKILPIKAFGPGGAADASVIYQAITYAIDQKVNVMNLSFSATDTTPDIRDAIQEAVQDGIIVAAAAGNSNVASAIFPASLGGVVGAGAVDGTNSFYPKASFSNFDPGVGQIVDADVAAPGVQLFTTYPGAGQIWATVSGTSFSAPLVAGEAALLVERNKTGASSRQDIENSANPSIEGNAKGAMGHGLINVMGALRLATPVFLLWW